LTLLVLGRFDEVGRDGVDGGFKGSLGSVHMRQSGDFVGCGSNGCGDEVDLSADLCCCSGLVDDVRRGRKGCESGVCKDRVSK
jgi:hypothetical protein